MMWFMMKGREEKGKLGKKEAGRPKVKIESSDVNYKEGRKQGRRERTEKTAGRYEDGMMDDGSIKAKIDVIKC